MSGVSSKSCIYRDRYRYNKWEETKILCVHDIEGLKWVRIEWGEEGEGEEEVTATVSEEDEVWF